MLHDLLLLLPCITLGHTALPHCRIASNLAFPRPCVGKPLARSPAPVRVAAVPRHDDVCVCDTRAGASTRGWEAEQAWGC